MKKILNQLMERREVARMEKHLKEAFLYVAGRSLHLRVEQFSRAITRFETAWRRNQGPPRRQSRFHEALARAREANGGPLPTDEYELAKILLDKDSSQ